MDVRTLIATNVVLLAGYAAALWLLATTNPELQGVRWVQRGFTCGALGSLLIALRGGIPDLLSVLVGCGLIIFAMVLMHAGIAEFLGKRGHRLRPDFSVLALMMVFFFWYTYAAPSVGARIVIYSLAMSMETGLMVKTLSQSEEAAADVSQWGMMMLLGSISILSLARAVFTVFHGAPGELMTHDPYQAAAVLVQMLVSAGLAFGFVWMTTAHLRHELEKMARTDFLTGLLNRRALLVEAEREIARSQLYETPLSVLIIDIDHFKQINDTYGHSAGDRALCAIAEVLKSGMRGYDCLARYGGEEFVLLLPNTGRDDALRIAERIRQSIEWSSVQFPRQSFTVTASIGVAELHRREEDWEALIHRGDHALYAAKDSGRNCIVVA